jgi:dTDP-4-amino-4,6-dideoxygalactose transaminase
VTYVPADPLLALPSLWDPQRAAHIPPPPSPPGLFLENGRTALWGALGALGLRPGDRLALPAYICDSVLPALAARGIEPRYVDTDQTLAIDQQDLAATITEGTRAVLVVHYFGLPAPGLAETRAVCERLGVPLIEDCAHALYSRDESDAALGSRSAAAIFSPWKSLALPDGGLLALRSGAVPAELEWLPRPSRATTLRRLAYRAVSRAETLVGWSPRLWALRSQGLRRGLQQRVAESPLAPRRGSRWAERALAESDWQLLVAQRRANWRVVDLAIREVGWCEPLFADLPAGACPLAYPILVPQREIARRALLAAGINVRAYWERLPTGVWPDRYPEAHEIARQILVLPIHQDVSSRLMEHLLNTLTSLERAWPIAS